MARHNEALELLKQGNSPSQIAKTLGIATSSALGYLQRCVGEEPLCRYEILLHIDRESREIVETVIEEGPFESVDNFVRRAHKALEDGGCSMDRQELLAYLKLRDAFFADIYKMLRKIETNLHRSIRKALVEKYGRDSWWREGVPENIRMYCATACEGDSHQAGEPYSYATFIHLKEIYDKQWGLLSQTLPRSVSCDKRKFLSSMNRLNRIRNTVMHPVRGDRLKDDDFGFVESFRNSLGIRY